MRDKDIYKQLLQHDEYAYKAFVIKYRLTFYKVAEQVLRKKFGNSYVDDCVSNAFIYIWYHINIYDPKKYSFRNWAIMVIYSQAMMVYRKLMRRQKRITLPRYLKYDDVEDIIIAKELYDALLNKINTFKYPMCEILMRRCIAGDSPQIIAEEMTIDITKVYYYIYEGMKKLKIIFEAELK